MNTSSVNPFSKSKPVQELLPQVAPSLTLTLDTGMTVLPVPTEVLDQISTALTNAMTNPNDFKTTTIKYTQEGLDPIKFTVSFLGRGAKPNLSVGFQNDNSENSVTGQTKPISYFPHQQPGKIKSDVESLLRQVVRAKYDQIQAAKTSEEKIRLHQVVL